jgi:hypothetical protein
LYFLNPGMEIAAPRADPRGMAASQPPESKILMKSPTTRDATRAAPLSQTGAPAEGAAAHFILRQLQYAERDPVSGIIEYEEK